MYNNVSFTISSHSLYIDKVRCKGNELGMTDNEHNLPSVSGSLCGLWLWVAMEDSRLVELHKGGLFLHHGYSKGGTFQVSSQTPTHLVALLGWPSTQATSLIT